jgi:hypothetical protein
MAAAGDGDPHPMAKERHTTVTRLFRRGRGNPGQVRSLPAKIGRPYANILRQRYKVMTLTPSVRAISLCSFPCVARSSACATLAAISAFDRFPFLCHQRSLGSIPHPHLSQS